MSHIWAENVESPNKGPFLKLRMSDGLMEACALFHADEVEGYAKALIAASKQARRDHAKRKAKR